METFEHVTSGDSICGRNGDADVTLATPVATPYAVETGIFEHVTSGDSTCGRNGDSDVTMATPVRATPS